MTEEAKRIMKKWQQQKHIIRQIDEDTAEYVELSDALRNHQTWVSDWGCNLSKKEIRFVKNNIDRFLKDIG